MTLSERIKQCKTIAELARLIGEGSESAVIHILMLRDIEVLSQQSKVLRSSMQLLGTAINTLEIALLETANEIEDSKTLVSRARKV